MSVDFSRVTSNLVLDLKEIWDSRNILRSLVYKNMFGRYKNSFFGFLWHFFAPIMMMIVYYVVFTELRTSSLDNYWVFVASGLFPFNFMLSNLTSGAGTIVGNTGMVKKMYFPREVLVLAHVLSSFIIMLIGYLIIICAMVISGFGLRESFILVPLLFIITLVFSIGYTLFFSSLTVYCRDVQYFLSSITMVFFFMTPMYFSADTVSGILGTIIWANPFTYFVESYHELVYFGSYSYMTLVCSSILSVVALVLGWFTFSCLKKGFVERL